jgi:LPXTG-motif cell wall-anchored protein
MSEQGPDDTGAAGRTGGKGDDWIVLLIVAVLIGIFLFIFVTVG